MKRSKLSGRFAQVGAVIALAFALMLATVLAQGSYAYSLEGTERSAEDIAESVSAMLAAGDYAEGEAIVCSIKSSTGALPLKKGSATDLLASAEELSTVTKDQYNSAVTQNADEPGNSARVPMRKGMGADEVEISLVRSDDMSTEELLTALLEDSRVLSAEPNYILSYEDFGEDEAAAETDETADIVAVPADEAATDEAMTSDDAAVTDDAASAEDAPVLAAPAEDVADTLAAEDDGPEPQEPATLPKSDVLANAVAYDLTPYQWFSTGSQSIIPQYADGTNPGVRAPKWNTIGETNATGVVVILDSGVDYTHPDLKNVMYRFTPEQQAELGCGEYGYAPNREDVTDPMDGFNHGTHCAGIVAAEWNGYGVSGIASGVKIMAVSVAKSLDNSEFGYDAIIKGYDFIIRAAKSGIDIRSINRSLEAPPSNIANDAMVTAAGEQGIVTCVASGNVTLDLDREYSDVAMYQQNPYILRVDASKAQDDWAWFSNYGTYTADVFSPGVSILSTIPSNLESESRYFPQFDSDPLYYQTEFDGKLLDYTGSDMCDVNGISTGVYGVDGDGKSQAADITIRSESTCYTYIDIPTGEIEPKDIQDVSIALYAQDTEIRFIHLDILMEDGTYLDQDQEMNTNVNSTSASEPCGWCYASLHIYDPSAIDQNFKYVTDSQGRTCIRVSIRATMNKKGGNGDATIDRKLHIDQVSIGKPGNTGFMPYMYMNGTSMATPVVTGCAAIVSSTITGVSPATRAQQTVQLLKGSVHQTEGYYGYCKQNGQIDLGILSDTSAHAPVLNSATVQGNKIILYGANFGDAGTLTLAGNKIQASTWTDTEIVLDWPADLASGLIAFSVTSSRGLTAQSAFILEAPATVENTAKLYEHDLARITLDGAPVSALDTPDALAVTESGILFAAVPDGAKSNNPYVSSILRSDDKGETWTEIELPIGIKNVMLTAGGNRVYVFGATPANDPAQIDTWWLYYYDLETETLQFANYYEHFGPDINELCSIICVGDDLYLIDNHHEESVFDEETETWSEPPTHIRIRRFAEDFSLEYVGELKHDYSTMGFYYPPKVSACGNVLYATNIGELMPGDEAVDFRGLERVVFEDDGSLTVTDLSEAVYDLDVDQGNLSLVATEQGVFAICSDLDMLLPEGAPKTDTFFMKNGATAFEPYEKTLSFSPIINPIAVYSDGWIYAYGMSKFELEVQFGRATKLAEVKTGWLKEDGRWHYYLEDGTQLTSDWVKYEGKWYYFDESGELLKEGWVNYEGKWYYFKDYTPMKEGWATYEGKYYYFKDYNPMQEGWVKYEGKYYYLKDYTPMLTGWVNYQGSWYYIQNYNPVVNGWVYDGAWYHFNGSGVCDRKA